MKRPTPTHRAMLALALVFSLVATSAAEGTQQAHDLNTVTEAELVALPGIGPTRAKAIVAYRAVHPFRSVSDLLRIKGIGRKTLARLRPLLTVAPRSPATTRPMERKSQP